MKDEFIKIRVRGMNDASSSDAENVGGGGGAASYYQRQWDGANAE